MKLRFDSLEERDDHIVALAREYLPPSDIEQRVEASRATITKVLVAARKIDATIPRFRSNGTRVDAPEPAPWTCVAVKANVRDALKPFAGRRGLSVGALVGRILTVLLDDKLIDAVLDDGGGT